MTDLRDKIAGIIWHDRQGQNTPESVADAILALPETAGWTALEAATEELANAEDTIANLTEALQSIVIEHDSPIWGEDHEYRVAFERSVAIAEAALAQTKGDTQ